MIPKMMKRTKEEEEAELGESLDNTTKTGYSVCIQTHVQLWLQFRGQFRADDHNNKKNTSRKESVSHPFGEESGRLSFQRKKIKKKEKLFRRQIVHKKGKGKNEKVSTVVVLS